MASISSHWGRPEATAAASRALGDGGPPAEVFDDWDDDALFSDTTAAIAAAAAAAAAGFLDSSCSSDDVDGGGCGSGDGERSWARHGFKAAGGGVDDDRLPGSGSGLSALRLPPLKLPVSDDGSCEHTTYTL